MQKNDGRIKNRMAWREIFEEEGNSDRFNTERLILF